MRPLLALFLLLAHVAPQQCAGQQIAAARNSILRLEMQLSAYGVESDTYPTISVYIDFRNDSSFCRRSYYDPKYPSSVYTLSKARLAEIARLLSSADLSRLKAHYPQRGPDDPVPSDQPTSTTRIIFSQGEIEVSDYGLTADPPL